MVARLAEVAEDGARLHRGQLVCVAEEDQPATFRQRGRQADHQRQVGHRAFIDDQSVEAVHPAGPARQQAVNGPRLGRKLAKLGHPVEETLAQLLADRLLDARGGLSGGRREADPARVGQACVDECRDQLGGQRRLAGAGAAGDDAEPPLQRDAQRRDRLGGSIFPGVEDPCGGGLGAGRQIPLRCQGAQTRRQPAFGVEQAVQVEAVAVQDEGPVVRRVRVRGDDGASSQRLAQRGARGKGDRLQVGRQRLLRAAGVGSLHERRDRLAGVAEVEAGVAVPVQRAGRGRSQGNVLAGAEVHRQPGKVAVDVGENAGSCQGVDLLVAVHGDSPKQASIASTQARDGRSWNTPLPGAFGLMPRRKR